MSGTARARSLTPRSPPRSATHRVDRGARWRQALHAAVVEGNGPKRDRIVIALWDGVPEEEVAGAGGNDIFYIQT